MNNPLHRIECWNGTFFRSADLWEVGVYLLIQHRTEESACRSLAWQKETLESLQLNEDEEEQRRLVLTVPHCGNVQSVPTAPHCGNVPSMPTAPLTPAVPTIPDQLCKDEESDEEEEESDAEDLGGSGNAKDTWFQTESAPRQDALNNNYVRVVHVNGIHHIALVTCPCHGAKAVHADLMYNQLVPTTFSLYNHGPGSQPT
jgi:hypothetical protein